MRAVCDGPCLPGVGQKSCRVAPANDEAIDDAYQSRIDRRRQQANGANIPLPVQGKE